MLVPFDIKFIRQDQKQHRNGEASLAIPTLFLVEPDKLDIKGTYLVFYLYCIISRFNGEKTAKQMKSRHSFVRTC